MLIVHAGRNHLHASFIPKEERLFLVILENNPKQETVMFPDLTAYGNLSTFYQDVYIYQCQRELSKASALLSRLLLRYDQLYFKAIIESEYVYDTPIDWRKISFTRLKMELEVDLESNSKTYFRARDSPIQFSIHGYPKNQYHNPKSIKTSLLDSMSMPADLPSDSSLSPCTPLTHASFKTTSQSRKRHPE